MSKSDKRNRGHYVLSLFAPRKSKGLSGRALRKLPFLAHALFVKVNVYFCTKEDDGKALVILKMLCLPADNDSDSYTVSGGYEPSC